MLPRPGEIYWAHTGGGDRHRVVIVSRDQLNRGDYVIGVLLTSEKFEIRQTLPNCAPFRAGRYGLAKNCVAQGESITLLQKSDLDLETGAIAALDGEDMRRLIRAIGNVISAECEPV